MKALTTYVLPNEVCWGLTEAPMVVPQVDGSTVERWIQDIVVVRNDERLHFITDFGDPDEYEMITPIILQGDGETTVAEMQYEAERNRNDTYWQTRAREQLEASTLLMDIVEQRARYHEYIHNRTVSGPAVFTQRNVYPQQWAWRKYFDERARRTGKRTFS